MKQSVPHILINEPKWLGLSQFWPLLNQVSFWGSSSRLENGLEPKTEQPLILAAVLFEKCK